MNFVFTTSFFLYLHRIDQYIAKKTGEASCPICGSQLDIRNWYRKGFGVPPGCDGQALIRHSFCCSCCRTSITPNSLRFMYYKRNAICSELIICALIPGSDNDKKVAKELQLFLGIDRKTLNIFRKWWRERFGGCLFARQEAANICNLQGDDPLSTILRYFMTVCAENLKKALVNTLIFLARYRTDRHWYRYRQRGGGTIALARKISPFSMA